MSENKKNWHKIKEDHEKLESMEAEDDLDNEEGVLDSKEELALDSPDLDDLEVKLTAAEQKAHKNWELATRAQAELENVRRRAQKEIDDAHKYSSKNLLLALLPVVDSLDQGLQLSEKDKQSSMHEGLELTMKLLLDVLEKNGVQQIDPLNEPFNPQEHEAMSMQESNELPSNTVLAVFQKGYKLHDRVLRPARVVVAKSNIKN